MNLPQWGIQENHPEPRVIVLFKSEMMETSTNGGKAATFLSTPVAKIQHLSELVINTLIKKQKAGLEPSTNSC